MSEPTPDVLIAQIEEAIEDGDLDTGRTILDHALVHFGSLPELELIKERLQEVGQIASRPVVSEWLDEAREQMHSADYGGAVATLRKAAKQQPDDSAVMSMLRQAEKSETRHSAAVGRQQAIDQGCRQVETLMAAGQLQEARDRLQQIALDQGRHPSLDALQERLVDLFTDARRKQAEEHFARAQELLDAKDWHGALHQADQVLALHPKHPEAAILRERAKTRIDQDEGHRQHREAVAEAQQDVERLIAARETKRADERLQQAIDQLGNEARFAELATLIDDAKKDVDLRKRVEWGERRAKEAESLIQEAATDSLRGDFTQAIEKLEAAQKLDSSHPEIAGKMTTARHALERQQAERSQSEARSAAVNEVRSLLDGLHLDDAEVALRAARQSWGDLEALNALDTRLQRLRQAEDTAVAVLPTPAELPSLGRGPQQIIRDRQRALAKAYSWQQMLRYPLRGRALIVFGILLASWIILDLLAPSLTAVRWLRWLAPVFVAAGWPMIMRSTLAGGNGLPERLEWATWPRDGARLAALTLLVAAPLLVLLIARPWLGWWQSDSAADWWLLAAMVWGSCALWTVAATVAVSFGMSYARQLGQHRRALSVDKQYSLLTINGIFLWLLVVTVIRVGLTPQVPWLGSPLAAVLEIYGLLLIPHLLGVQLRRRRLQWAQVYSTSSAPSVAA